MSEQPSFGGPRLDRQPILVVYTAMERAVLAAYLEVDDPRPDDLLNIDVTRPVPQRWSERTHGIGPQDSDVAWRDAASRSLCSRRHGHRSDRLRRRPDLRNP